MNLSIGEIDVTPELRKLINANIPKGGRIGTGWAPEEEPNELCELATGLLKGKLTEIFEISARKHKDAT